MIKVVIIDDNAEFLKEVYEIVKSYFEQCRIPVMIKTYNSSQLLLYDLNEKMIYDIYFLDIEMPGINGLQLASDIRKEDEKAIIIFITSYLKYSIVGYELGIFRYIPKTNLKEKLVAALQSASAELGKMTEQFYIVSTPTKYEKIKYSDILYIYKDRKYAIINCKESIYKVRKSLKEVYDDLAGLGKRQFIFIERGYIVNIMQINKIQNGEVLLMSGETLHIGRSYYSEIKKNIAEFWSDK